MVLDIDPLENGLWLELIHSGGAQAQVTLFVFALEQGRSTEQKLELIVGFVFRLVR
jgi:hypothetical protein